MDSQAKIRLVCDEIREMLVEKNKRYADSAIHPIRIFSKSDNVEQIRVRIDDKLNRLMNQTDDENEDTVLDLIGYLVLYRVAKMKTDVKPGGSKSWSSGL